MRNFWIHAAGLLVIALCASPIAAASDPPEDAAAIMAKVAANVEKSAEERRQYVYHQKVRSSLVRSSGDVARREKREYSVFPNETSTDKKLVSFTGEYRKGKQMIPYTEPGFHYKDPDLDGDLIRDLTKDLVDSKDSRDGIPHSLFPLRTKDLPGYSFSLVGETEMKGRRTYQIAFEPQVKQKCVEFIGENDECDGASWKGDAWIDVAELQPVRIETHLAFKIPWGVRVFLGTDLRQTGFSISYQRIAENVWFPATYGTEFRFGVLWAYKRTVTLSLESSGFQRTDASSKIEYDISKQ